MGWLALDDTDTLEGGCTTHTFHKILSELNKMSINGRPWSHSSDERLVRLWPYAARRTRGNAAVSAKIEIDSELRDEFFETVELLFSKYVQTPSKNIPVSHHSRRKQYPAAPVLIWFEKKPSEEHYWNAVRNEVNAVQIFEEIKSTNGIKIWSYDEIDGIIGAQAAAAWEGTHSCTWELTAYRSNNMIGKQRIVPLEIVSKMDEKFPETILNRDPNASQSLIAPRSNCPVLYGIRSRDSISAESAHLWMQTQCEIEHSPTYRIWRTNQATDDHLIGKWVGTALQDAQVHENGHATVKVTARLENNMIQGGVRKSEISLTLVAFSKGGPVNSVLRGIMEGDVFEWRGLISPSGDNHVEKIKMQKPVLRNRKRPLCKCGKRMKSLGKGQGLRCPKCKTVSEDKWVGEKYVPHLESKNGWVQPNIDSRRHLASPLQ